MGLVGKITELFGSGAPDAIGLLEEDHKKVKKLFRQFESAEGGRAKQRIVAEAIKELKVHAQVEEEIFYHALRKVVEEDKVDEAEEEHHVMRLLIAELEKMTARTSRYDAKFTVLAESVRHHIEEEESEVFPEAKGKIDEAALGERLLARKQELMQRNGRGRRPRKATRASRRSQIRRRADEALR
jgi:hemerythrin-like domain-containing protein